MKIRSERDKRNYIIIALCLILVIMGVGYSAFSSLLTINGTASISNSWCVGFDNTKTNTMVVTKGVSTGQNPTGSMTYSGTACGSTLQPNSSLTAAFHQPGDQIEYTLTITNKSTVTAVIKSILVDNESVTSNTTKKKDNITYIVEMPESTTLASNASTTMKIIAKFQNETDVTGPYSGETKTIEVKINAEQDDGNGGFTPTAAKFTGTIYRWSTKTVEKGSMIAGEGWCDIETSSGNQYDCFDTETECNTFLTNNGYNETDTCQKQTITAESVLGDYTTDASLLNKTYYLKHDVVDDKITVSYVCFVYNNAEHCMKGGDGGASFAANTQTIKDYQTFYNLNNVSNPSSSNPGCNFDSSYSHCYGGEFESMFVSGGGRMAVYGSSGYCGVNSIGSSNCDES